MADVNKFEPVVMEFDSKEEIAEYLLDLIDLGDSTEFWLVVANGGDPDEIELLAMCGNKKDVSEQNAILLAHLLNNGLGVYTDSQN